MMACWAAGALACPILSAPLPCSSLSLCSPHSSISSQQCRFLTSKYRSWLWPHHRRRVHQGVEPSSSGGRGRGLVHVIVRSVIVFIVTLVAGLVAVRVRGLAQGYVESKVLPPVAALLSYRLGRRIELGKVESIWPLGINLKACSVGPHDEEFSCVQLPNVSIRINPFRSIEQGQVAADVILTHPHFLVSQKQDWTWLGLPIPSTTSLKLRKLNQDNSDMLDARTKRCHLAKRSAFIKQADQRITSARQAALTGYKLPDFGDGGAQHNHHHPHVDEARVWEPFKSLFKVRPGASSVDKLRFQEINLRQSAAKARRFFHNVDGGATTHPNGSDIVDTPVSTTVHAQTSKAGDGSDGWEDQFDKLVSNCDTAQLLLRPSSSQGLSLLQESLDRLPQESLVHRLWNNAKGTQESRPDTASVKENYVNSSTADDKAAPIALDSVYIRDGTFMLLAYGDNEPRLLDKLNGSVKLGNDYQLINVQVTGCPRVWRTTERNRDGGFLTVDVNVDVKQQAWDVKAKGHHLYAPLLERLLEVPLDCYRGTANGEVHVWMNRGDEFPNLGGKVDIKNVSFKVWEAPAAFKEIDGTLFFQGQRAFLHNTTGLYGDIPLSVSGDLDLNPENGEYRLSCQVAGIEVNALMSTLNVRPLPFSVAGAVKAVVYCRGPLDAPIFEGSAETLKKRLDLMLSGPPSLAEDSIKRSVERGASAAYDRVAFSNASASFTFDTDSCIANVYGIRATPVGGGEIRGAGDMWICPEAETDPSAVRIDCSGHVMINDILQSYAPTVMEFPPFGAVHGEAKIRGSLLMPVFDIKWVMPDAKGSFNNARGDIAISDEGISLNSSSFTFDVYTKLSTKSISLEARRNTITGLPGIEGLEMDVRLRGFDMLDVVTPARLRPPDGTQMKMTGRFKFQGRVTENALPGARKVSGLVGDISLLGVKLNQLLVALNSTGSLEVSDSSFKLNTSGRGKDHLYVQLYRSHDNSDEVSLFSLQRGQLQVDLSHSPYSLAKIEIRNFPLDELEVASLRGMLQKVDVQLNLQKRRGHGYLSVRRPRFSGIHGELLDVSARWAGDVVTLEKSLLEQANSTYELRGEYVLPGPRDKGNVSGRLNPGKGMWQKVMAGHLGNAMDSLGRWRLRLEVPKAELADMLPVARLLSRSSDPAIVTRSKELFLQGVEKAAFLANNIKQEIEFIKRGNATSAQDERLSDSVPLPGLTELKGHWHGTFEASGGGNSDITANLDLHGENWEWGTYNIQNAIATGSYCYADGLRLEKVFLQSNAATLHSDGMLGPSSNLHFALLNFPVELVPPLMQAARSSSAEPLLKSSAQAPLNGVLHIEGDLRGDLNKPECDVHVRLLDGAVGGVNLNRADLAASLMSGNQFVFNARLEPVMQAGHVHVRGSVPLGADALDQPSKSRSAVVKKWMNDNNFNRKENREGDEKLETGWQVDPGSSFTASEWDFIEARSLYVDVVIKDSGMMLLTAATPHVKWLQGNADVRLQVRGAAEQPKVQGMAFFHRVSVSSPVLPRQIFNLGGTVGVKDNEVFVNDVEGRVGKKGRLLVKGKLPLKSAQEAGNDDNIQLKVDALEVRAKNTFSGLVDGQLSVLGSIYEPELTGCVKLSGGQIYLSQEKNSKTPASTIPRALSDLELLKEESSKPKLPVAVRLKGLKLQFGPELRMVYPLILNFAVNGELEFFGFADYERIKPKGVLTFENGDVNLVATQVRLNKDYLNRAKFEPEQGLDPNLDLALVGAHWQLKVQGRAQNWQDSLVLTSARSGEEDALTRVEAAKLFENQLVDSLLEGNGQFAFKKLAAATVETLMPKIETKGEFGQARWRLVYAPQIPNLLSLDPSTDPFKTLAFGTEVEVRLGKHLQASVVRQLKDSEMATQWTLTYHLNNKLRLVFTSIPSVDNRLLFEYSASS